MSVCLAASGKAVALAISAFTLSWDHSVEKTEWREDWRVSSGALVLDRASVSATGAGMDIPDGAELEDGRWVYEPDLPPLEVLRLADAGAAPTDWRLCVGGHCRAIGNILRHEGPLGDIEISACDEAGVAF